MERGQYTYEKTEERIIIQAEERQKRTEDFQLSRFLSKVKPTAILDKE